MGDGDFTAKMEAFDIHRRIYSTMIWFGIYKLHSPNIHIERLHSAYRMLILALVFILNFQHFIYLYEIFIFSNGSGLQFDACIEEISHINFFGKLLALSLNSSRLDALHTLIKDPIFAPENAKDEEYIKEYKAKAIRLFKMVNGWMAISITLWVLNRLFKKFENPEYTLPSYVPYDNKTWTGFLATLTFESTLGIWTGFGHYGLDCMIVSYYMQATSQLKSIKWKLRHVFDRDSVLPDTPSVIYEDELDKSLNERFIYYVRRYGKITWFINQVNSALTVGISVNFMTLSLAMCLIVYSLGSTDLFSVEFLFMFAALFVFQAQNFMYCYFGHLVQYESDSVNTAVYFSDWLSVSPKFRRKILIAMVRWHYQLIPRVSSVVPVSLTTFVSVTRLAYTIYTVMKSYESKSI